MATRNQILGMFGARPDQIQAAERDRMAALMASQQTNEQRLGSGIGMALGSLFKQKSPEMQMAEKMQGAMQGIDPNDATQLRALAQTVAEFAPERALQIASYANELEKQTTGERVNFPMIVGYEPIMKVDAFGNSVKAGDKPVYRDVPHTKNADGKYVPMKEFTQPETSASETPPPPSADGVFNIDTGVVELGATGSGVVLPGEPLPQPETQPQGVFDPGVAVPMTGIPGQEPSTGPQRTGNFIPEDTGIPTQMPNIEGQVTFGDPTELKAVSDELRDQITALSNSDDPEKDAKIAALKKKRAQVSKLILNSRRQLASKNPLGGIR